ncbi:MAG: hypothetical protein AB4352_29865 [Hormoscilla sp.]
MYYSEFTLEELESKFQLTITEEVPLFDTVEPVTPSGLLRETLAENIPLALAVDTEKARSELIVAPILVEMRKQFERQISVFSGTEFNVDRSKGLSGRCDFIISHSPRQLSVTAPVATLVEAKDDNIKSGICQCIAEMVADQIFNQQKNNPIPSIYGIVTTGSIWKFMKLAEKQVANAARKIEPGEHFINNLESLLGILSYIIHTTRPQTQVEKQS